MQTVGALEHVSYNEPGIYSYEQVLLLRIFVMADRPPRPPVLA
jgi:hypothetical protein